MDRTIDDLGDRCEIRAVRPADHDWVARVNNAAVPYLAVTTDWLAGFLRLPGRSFIACVDGAPLGFALGLAPGGSYPCPYYRWFSDRYGDDFFYLDRVVVDEPHRRRGVGRALCRAAEADARGRFGQLTMEVYQTPPDEPLLGLLDALGFRAVGTRRPGDGGREVALMAKPVG